MLVVISSSYSRLSLFLPDLPGGVEREAERGIPFFYNTCDRYIDTGLALRFYIYKVKLTINYNKYITCNYYTYLTHMGSIESITTSETIVGIDSYPFLLVRAFLDRRNP